MDDSREQLLDELARAFARAAVDALLAEQFPTAETTTPGGKPGAVINSKGINSHEHSALKPRPTQNPA